MFTWCNFVVIIVKYNIYYQYTIISDSDENIIKFKRFKLD